MTFINYKETASNHKVAADSYENILGTVESFIVLNPELRGDPTAILRSIHSQYDEVLKKSPGLNKKYISRLLLDDSFQDDNCRYKYNPKQDGVYFI